MTETTGMIDDDDTDELIRLAQEELAEIQKQQSQWDEKHSFNEPMLKFINADGLGHTAKPPNFLIQDILETDGMGILAGSSGAYKSFLALAVAHSICTGNDFFGNRVYGAHKVMYICGEGQAALSRRVRAIQLQHGDFDNNLMSLDGKIRIDNEDDINAVSEQINRFKPALVIFDTFSSMNSRTNENDNSEVANVLSMMSRHISNGFTTSMIVHHFGKDADRGIRGASAFGNNVDFVFSMVRDKESMQTTLSCRKMKDGDDFTDLILLADKVPLGIYGQNGEETTSLVLRHYDGKFAGKKPDQYAMIMEEYLALLAADPRPTILGNGVCKKIFYKNLIDSLEINKDALYNAMSRFKEKYGNEKCNEINGIFVLS
jgi:RecA-family ATPase